MIFEKTKDRFSVSSEGKVLLRHSVESPFAFVGRGKEDIEMYRGNFKIEDYIVERKPLNTFEILKEDEHELILDFENILQITIRDTEGRMTIDFKGESDQYNRIWIRLPSRPKEKLYGLGEQMSYFNLKGRSFPVWTSEPGVGRDKSTYVTWRSDVENKAGGDYYTTNFPQPTYISIDHHYVHLHSTAYSKFNFENDDFTEIEIWEIPERVTIGLGNSLIDTVMKLSDLLGKQPELPDWAYNGLIIGAQGGTERVREIVKKSQDHDIQIAALWCQDWCGKKVTSFGRRLKWNWEWDEEEYLTSSIHAGYKAGKYQVFRLYQPLSS